jgi:hypothetical protein
VVYFIVVDEPVVREVKEMRICLEDFEVGRCLSKGGTFGLIHLVKERSDGRVFVMKSTNKFDPNVQQRVSLIFI